ncbi:hypothetical protein LEP1GSC058_1959 [Leptospira fainei serovar Hurstbridge str. BUT 6]|uniref:Uncharacterized protein n=1 Tax=Leptospira fainei serovar Hurstbridge str. BUT 6 TaxID=1193011 RepID=S3V2C7_9LEPT|nr:hypothetical protein LEP1GSC058_1959 [Leptospira fainei serovar Hurstbridge str. BUT 6]
MEFIREMNEFYPNKFIVNRNRTTFLAVFSVRYTMLSQPGERTNSLKISKSRFEGEARFQPFGDQRLLCE